ncbi:hypothetical protein BC943DRAFT_343669 [Umbelopsis sp. AD052]|nr:hypothetical protein BC943DRAFT_343669 [Umbelopsis sp. AD052]
MAFRFNFSNPDSDNEDDQLDTGIQAISLKTESEVDHVESDRMQAVKFDIEAMKLPDTLQADRVAMSSIDYTMYRRTLADVKFQIARQDDLEADQTPMIEMAGNTDLIKGIYEGGFKTWECSIDLVEFMHTKMDDSSLENKKVLELGCGSALPGIYLLMRHASNQVDFQDYNEQVLQYITIPNIILNTVVAPSEASAEEEPEIEQSGLPQDNANVPEEDSQDDEDEEEPHADEEEMDSADAELEISETQAPDILNKLSQRSQCYFGEWQSLTNAMNLSDNLNKYDMIVTSETVYSEDSIPGLVTVLQNTLKKPDGVA